MRARIVLVSVALAIVAVPAGLLALPQLGWCWSQHRFIARQEIIAAAIDEVLSRKRVGVSVSVPGGVRGTFHDVIPFGARGDFMAANPACCQIAPAAGDEGCFVPWWGRWLAGVPHNVRMVYVARYRDDDGAARAVVVRDNIPVNACGRVSRLGC